MEEYKLQTYAFTFTEVYHVTKVGTSINTTKWKFISNAFVQWNRKSTTCQCLNALHIGEKYYMSMEIPIPDTVKMLISSGSEPTTLYGGKNQTDKLDKLPLQFLHPPAVCYAGRRW